MEAVVPAGAWGERQPRGAMCLEVTSPEVDARSGLRAYVEERLVSGLGCLVRHVEWVTVQIESVDLRPLKGAYRCRMAASLARGRDFLEDEVDADPRAAVDRATEALVRSIGYIDR